MTQLLQNTPLSSDQQEIVRTIQSSGDSLLVIINDILDFSKIEAGKMELAEDNPVNKKVVQGILKKIGYSSVIVNNGSEVLNAYQGDEQKCIRAGMDDCLAKPIQTEQLSHINTYHLRLSQQA